jgi:hypothetical protein
MVRVQGRGVFHKNLCITGRRLTRAGHTHHIPAFFCGLKDYGIAIDAHGGVPLHNGLSIGGIGVRCPESAKFWGDFGMLGGNDRMNVTPYCVVLPKKRSTAGQMATSRWKVSDKDVRRLPKDWTKRGDSERLKPKRAVSGLGILDTTCERRLPSHH